MSLWVVASTSSAGLPWVSQLQPVCTATLRTQTPVESLKTWIWRVPSLMTSVSKT